MATSKRKTKRPQPGDIALAVIRGEMPRALTEDEMRTMTRGANVHNVSAAEAEAVAGRLMRAITGVTPATVVWN